MRKEELERREANTIDEINLEMGFKRNGSTLFSKPYLEGLQSRLKWIKEEIKELDGETN